MIDLSKNILKDVEDFSGSVLIKKHDLQILIDEANKNNVQEKFEELAFSGKYVEGLKRVLAKGSEIKEVENLDYVKKDLAENLEKIIEQIRSILTNSSEELKNYFEETYLKLTANCYRNLNELTANLELIKRYLNYQKRSE